MAVSDDNRAQKRPASRGIAPQKRTSSRTAVQIDRRRVVPASTIEQDLRLLLARLRCIHAAAVTAAAVLKKQNADIDADVAITLRHAVTNPLMTEIEKLEALLGDAKADGC